MRILVSNDDGIFSPGLAALAEVASEFGEVRIVAPDIEQSSMSHAITGSRPLRYRPTPVKNFPAYRVDGTPADCVALGVSRWERVDLVVSGINLGLNVGNSIWHSGTLAAAKQAALLGLRGVAFSMPAGEEEPSFDVIKQWVRRAMRVALEESEMPLLNINFPENPRGLCWTRQSFRHYDGKIVPGKDPMGREHFWFTVVPIEQIEEGTDRWAVQHDLVSITPLRLDLTDDGSLSRARARYRCGVDGTLAAAVNSG